MRYQFLLIWHKNCLNMRRVLNKEVKMIESFNEGCVGEWVLEPSCAGCACCICCDTKGGAGAGSATDRIFAQGCIVPLIED